MGGGPTNGPNNGLANIIGQYKTVEDSANNNILENFRLINESKDTLFISDLVTSKKLIYRFSELHCDSCIINEFKNLKKHVRSEGMKIKDIIIITYYDNIRNLYIFKRINKLQDFEIYNLAHNNIGRLKLDDMLVPYFFMLNKGLRISDAFIPIKQADKRTDDYLERISEKISNANQGLNFY